MRRFIDLRSFFKMVLLIECVAIYFIFISSIGVNPQNDNADIQKLSTTFFPEGWAFFTKNPREPLLDVYKLNKDGKPEKFLFPNGDYLLGISRKSRVISYQLSNLLSEHASAFTWKNGAGNYKDSLASLNHCFPLPADEKYSLFDPGIYLFVVTERMPWLWEIDPLHTKKKFKLLLIEINPC